MYVLPGTLVTTSGWPLTTPDGHGLVLRREGAQYEPVPTLDLPWAVRTAPPTPERLQGELVDVRGLWDGHRIAIREVTASDSPGAPERTPIGTTTPGVPDRVRTAVDHLAASGDLAAWRVEHAPTRRIVVCVFDETSPVADLRATTGVEVVRCRWTRSALRAARSMYQRVPDELLSAFGENTRPDGQPEITLEVKYVTEQLANAVEALTGLVTVHGLIRRAEHS